VAVVAALAAPLLAGAFVWAATADWGVVWGLTRHLISSPEAFGAYLEGFGIWTPLALFFAQAAQVVLAFVPSGPVTVAGVAALGPWWGLTLSVAGGTAGSVVAFALARRYGRPAVARLAGEAALDRYSGALGDDGRWLLLAFQLPIPVGGDALCALAGLTRMPLGRFVLVSAVGRVPWTAFNVLVAAGLVSGSVGPIIAVGLLALVSTLLAARYARRAEGWLLRRGRPSEEGDTGGTEPSGVGCRGV
jgi:uncharacterized membrane protein YdjX (TVP38/TMEM64 family)